MIKLIFPNYDLMKLRFKTHSKNYSFLDILKEEGASRLSAEYTGLLTVESFSNIETNPFKNSYFLQHAKYVSNNEITLKGLLDKFKIVLDKAK